MVTEEKVIEIVKFLLKKSISDKKDSEKFIETAMIILELNGKSSPTQYFYPHINYPNTTDGNDGNDLNTFPLPKIYCSGNLTNN